MDHFRQIPTLGPPWHDMLESWTTLAHLAACTDTIRLGTMVSGITHRSVPLLGQDRRDARRAVGRAGDLRARHRVVRAGAPRLRVARSRRSPSATRCSRTRSRCCRRCGARAASRSTGRVLHVPDTSCYPRPLQERIPILVGGSGERRTLQLVAGGSRCLQPVRRARRRAPQGRRARRHCEALGRDPGSVVGVAPVDGAGRARTPPRCGRWSTPPARRRCAPSATPGPSTPAPSTQHVGACRALHRSRRRPRRRRAWPTSPTSTPSTATRR